MDVPFQYGVPFLSSLPPLEVSVYFFYFSIHTLAELFVIIKGSHLKLPDHLQNSTIRALTYIKEHVFGD